MSGPVSEDGRYIKIQIPSHSSISYGWSRFWTSGEWPSLTYFFGDWSYTSNSRILTLGESAEATHVVLSDGKSLLHFANANEEGIASYVIEVEKDGGWDTVVRFAPGDGYYSFATGAAAAHRLVTERVDGTTSVQAF